MNQAAHDSTCLSPKDETKLVWDRSSYTSVRGAKAVDVYSTNAGGPLIYRAVSENTLAISHV